MVDNIPTSDSTNRGLNNLDTMQTKLYQGVVDAEDEVGAGNNKYAVSRLNGRVGDVLEVLRDETSNSERYCQEVLKPVYDECGRLLVDSGRPNEKEVYELIGAVRNAINVYDEYDLRMIDWTDYM